MKHAGALILLSLVLQVALGQSGRRPADADARLCGTPDLSDPEVIAQAIQNTQTRSPGLVDIMAAHRLQKRTGRPSLLADELFWVYNLTTFSFDTVRARLMATGIQSNVWVSLSELANFHVTMAEVQAILDALENSTPANSRDSSKGILEIDRQFFGNPPNIDQNFVRGSGDGLTDFLICDIQDGWNGSGSYAAGYFFYVDVDPGSGFVATSNRRDMLYIDSYPGIFINNTRDPQRPLSTLAHEFQHLINWNYNPAQTIFFNEGLSEYAEYLCGYGLRNSGLYFGEMNHALLSWSGELYDYSRAALWTLYCGEQIGDLFIQKFAQTGLSGVSGFDNAAAQAASAARFLPTARNFFLANIIRDTSSNGAYGYVDESAVRGAPGILQDILGASTFFNRPVLQAHAADYIRFRGLDTASVSLTASGGTLNFSAIQYSNGPVLVNQLQDGTGYLFDFAGSGDPALILVAQNNALTGTAQYSVASTGAARTSYTLELANDDGVSQTSPNTLLINQDTLFVVFDGVVGGVLDSVRMWFTSFGSARLLVRRANPSYDLDFSPVTGLGGASLMSSGPVVFSVTDTAFFGTTVDLHTLGITTGVDFVVEVIYGASAPEPRLRRDTSQDVTRSFLYLASQPTGGRSMYASFGDFYLRAYVSPSGGIIAPPPQIPAQFALYPNFPNPFNSGTTIPFDVPEAGPVRLLVFDLLGREIRVLKNEVMAPQGYSVVWDGKDASGVPVPSGVYYCRLQSRGFSQTRKLMLLR